MNPVLIDADILSRFFRHDQKVVACFSYEGLGSTGAQRALKYRDFVTIAIPPPASGI